MQRKYRPMLTCSVVTCSCSDCERGRSNLKPLVPPGPGGFAYGVTMPAPVAAMIVGIVAHAPAVPVMLVSFAAPVIIGFLA